MGHYIYIIINFFSLNENLKIKSFEETMFLLLKMEYPKELNNNPKLIKEFLLLLKTKDIKLIKKVLYKQRKNNYNKEYMKTPEYRKKINEKRRNKRIELMI